MELLTANLGRVRKEVLHGRDFYVANSTMIVPGVLPGSKGPLLYQEQDVSRHPDNWNRMPIVVNHPTDENNSPTSARQPEILDKYQIGDVYRTVYNGRLVSEAWFDVELTRAKDRDLPHANKILPRLERGEPIELSTGLYTRNEPVSNGATHNGVPYTHVARDYRPDHLAVLPDSQGACSLRDGCGVLVNGRNHGILPEDVDEFLENMARNQPRDAQGRWTGGSGASVQGKKSKSADKLATKQAQEHINKAHELAKQGKTAEAKGHTFAAYGYNRAAQLHSEGKHREARAVAAVADEFASGKRKTKSQMTANESADLDPLDADWLADLHETPDAELDAVLNELPDMTAEKACRILKDGSVKGHKLTRQQQKMFGALCGQKPTANMGCGDQTSRAVEKCKCGKSDPKDCSCDADHGRLGTEHKTSTTVTNVDTTDNAQARVPAGSPHGGEFASVGGTSSGGKARTKEGALAALDEFAGRPVSRNVSKTSKLTTEDGEHIGWKVSFRRGSTTRINHGNTSVFATGADIWFDGRVTPTTNEFQEDPTTNEGHNMGRDADITYLTTNCDCWRGKADSLRAIPDDQVLANLRKTEEDKAQLTLTVNTLATGGNRTQQTGTGPKTAEQWYDEAPPEIREAVRNAKAIQDAEKLKLVERIVANNASTEKARALIRPTFAAMSLNDRQEGNVVIPGLITLAANLPEPTVNAADNPYRNLTDLGLYIPGYSTGRKKVNDYSGAAGGATTVTANRTETDEDPDEVLPVINEMTWN